MPSTISTMAMPGNTAVHQMPAVTSATERFRSYPHSAADVGSMPKPRKPSPASVRIASDELSVRMTGSVRVEFFSRCLVMMRHVEAPTTFADST